MTAEPAVIDGKPIRDDDGLDLFEAFTGGLLTRALRGSDVEPSAEVVLEKWFGALAASIRTRAIILEVSR